MSVLFITFNSNPKKVQGVKNALAKLPVSDFYFSPIKCKDNDQPIRDNDSVESLRQRFEGLFAAKKETSSNVFAIEIKKSSNLHEENEPLVLYCKVLIVAKDGSKVSLAKDSIPLSEEIRRLVKEENMHPYDAYETVYSSEQIKSKKVSLYEHITGKSEVDWFTDIVFKAFLF